jgi:peptidyl-prolyl cis-trans isomerase B (cyclophilin B)
LPGRQRRRRRGPTEYQGPRRAKPPFPINLIFNAKAFYIVFIVLIIASLAAAAIANTGSSGKRSQVPEAEDQVTAEETPSGLTFSAPAPTIDRSKAYLATVRTDKGDIKIDLSQEAPDTVNSFAFLAGSGFYNNTAFFYIDKQYVAQAGDPTCKADGSSVCSGAGGPGYTLPLQNATERKQWDVVAPTLVQGGEDVNGSQFRILYQDDPRPNVKETVFGKVVEGQAILENLNNLTPCSIQNSASCAKDLSSALVIREIIVEPKVV